MKGESPSPKKWHQQKKETKRDVHIGRKKEPAAAAAGCQNLAEQSCSSGDRWDQAVKSNHTGQMLVYTVCQQLFMRLFPLVFHSFPNLGVLF